MTSNSATTNIFGPYTPVRQAGDYYFVSGQVGVDMSTKQAALDVGEQATCALENLQNVLEQSELKMSDVVKTTVFLANMSDFSVFNDIYLQYFTYPRPARSCVEVAGLPQLADNALLVEIEAVAYKHSTTEAAQES